MPTTTNKGLIVPDTGTLPGAWGTAAINANMGYLDGLFGGVASISLGSTTTIVLSANSASITPAAGPFQQNNALIKFSGTLTGDADIVFTQPGFYIVENACTVGSHFVALFGGGTVIGAPPGRKCHIFFDGTTIDYVDMPEVGAALDLHGATALPSWMALCTTLPYLIKDGTEYAASAYPALAALLGNTFGGTGATFKVPDERARARIAYDPNSTGRLTTAGSGVNGNTMGSAGGHQLLQSHTHIDGGHTHSFTYDNTTNAYNAQSGTGRYITQFPGANSVVTAIGTAAIQTTGSGTGQNVQPSIVSFLPLIKT